MIKSLAPRLLHGCSGFAVSGVYRVPI